MKNTKYWQAFHPATFCGATDVLLNALSDNCPNLRVLELSGDLHFSTGAVSNFLGKCRKLEVVKLTVLNNLAHKGPDGRAYIKTGPGPWFATPPDNAWTTPQQPDEAALARAVSERAENMAKIAALVVAAGVRVPV